MPSTELEIVPRFRLPNWKHQQREWDLFRDAKARALLWQMRTGKTKAIIDKACYLFEKNEIDSVLILAQNGVHDNWIRREIPTHLWEGIDCRGHTWRSGARHGNVSERAYAEASAARMLDPHFKGLRVLAVNSEALINPHAQVLIRGLYRLGRVFLAVDESHDFRTPNSQRSRIARGLTASSAYRTILSGTPVHNTPLAAFAQYEILQKGALGFTRYTDFKGHFAQFQQVSMANGRTFPKLTGYQNLEELRLKIANWSSVVLRSDCEDLPPTQIVQVPFTLDNKLDHVYNEVRTTFGAEILDMVRGNPHFINGENPGVRLVKLQQIASGFVVTQEGILVSLVGMDEPNPRLTALVELLKELEGKKFIIWAQFHADIAIIRKALKVYGIESVEYHGLTPQKDRPGVIDQFQNNPKVRAFVGQPKAGGQGLNLSAASAIVWYSHTFDFIVRDQASERATRMGGEPVVIYDLTAFDAGGRPTIDKFILDMLDKKMTLSDYVAGEGLKELITILEGVHNG